MTVQVSDATSARRLSLSQKLAVASGAAAAFAGVASPQMAEAGIVQSQTLPKSPPASIGSNFWDVDGDGTNDFQLRFATSSGSSKTAYFTMLGPARFVGKVVNIVPRFGKLNAGFNVGASLVAGYTFFNAARSISITGDGLISPNPYQGGWAIGNTGYFGFKFSNTGGVHYGWGQMSITGTPTGQGYTLTEAYYNDTVAASIQVGDTGGSPSSVPEIDPASAGSVLSLVMGSLAMLERRRLRRAKAAEGDATVSA